MPKQLIGASNGWGHYPIEFDLDGNFLQILEEDTVVTSCKIQPGHSFTRILMNPDREYVVGNADRFELRNQESDELLRTLTRTEIGGYDQVIEKRVQ